MNNYPPGVTGNEFEIAGPDYEIEVEDICEECGASPMLQQGYCEHHWVECLVCGYTYDVDYKRN